ncbi:hypothetical protein [Mesorhizobium sp. SP-1A]|uniref:hypothetical protein n=1 Tax=Mesorhizobium sp. SP-1A TaxID=3077840 RepID=UPI0028F7204D|nr:hypothetical protein [Mesorhizobium sp. SP-1A]
MDLSFAEILIYIVAILALGGLTGILIWAEMHESNKAPLKQGSNASRNNSSYYTNLSSSSSDGHIYGFSSSDGHCGSDSGSSSGGDGGGGGD